MLRRAAAQASSTRRSTGSPGGGGARDRREQVFWGWGEPGAGPSLPDTRRGFLRAELGVAGAVVSRAGARSRTCGCARRRSPRPRCASGWSGGRACATTARRACCAAAASPTSTCWRQRAGDCEDAPDAVVAPADARAGAGGAAGVRRGGRRGRAVRRRHERGRRAGAASAGASTRWSRSTSGGWTRLESRRRALADRACSSRACGCRRPTARSREHGLHARPRAAELRVGDGRRLRRDALGRPGLDRARADRRERASRCAARRPPASSRRCDVPATRRRAGAAAARARLRGRARRDHAASRCACARCRRRSATRAGVARDFDEGCEALRAARAGRHRARHRAALRRGRRRAMSLALAGDGGRRRARWARVLRGRCLLVCGWEGARTRSARRRKPARAALRGGGRVAAGRRRRARRGPPRASPGRTCATTCSTAACWSRRSRPRRRGRTWRRCTAAVRARWRSLGRRSSAATSRTCTPTGASLYFTVLARAGPRRPGGAVAAREGRGDRRDRRGRRHDHPPPRGRRATTRRGWAPRPARSASSCCARSRSAATRPGS